MTWNKRSHEDITISIADFPNNNNGKNNHCDKNAVSY